MTNLTSKGNKNYENGEYDDDEDCDDDEDDKDDYTDDYNVFFHPKGPQTGLAPGGHRCFRRGEMTFGKAH